MTKDRDQQLRRVGELLAPTAAEKNQPDAQYVRHIKGVVTAVSGNTATVQFAESTAVPTPPIAGIHYLEGNTPAVDDVVLVAVTGPTRIILGTIQA